MLCAAIASPVSLGLVKRCRGFTAIFLDDSQLLQIARKQRIWAHAILETFQVRLEFGPALPRQRIDHPVLVSLHLDQTFVPQITEVLGDLHLRFPKDRLEMTDAERRVDEQMHDA